jgi:hypothetical protein
LEIECGEQIFDLEVAGISNDQITLHITPLTSEDAWKREGLWGLRWNGGYGQVGEIQNIRERHPSQGL